ncbi:MAG: DinB family protein [Chitinophagales bacterium]
MISQTPWTDRKFNFDFPAGFYPVFLERMRGTHAHIQEMVKDVSDKKLSKRIDGKWSAKEHIGHLTDLEELHMLRLQEFISGKEILSAADMKNQKTETAHHNDKKLKKLLKEFKKSRQGFVKLLAKADDELINRKSIHPRLKVPMRLVDMVYFICEHDDHHLTKMRALIAE